MTDTQPPRPSLAELRAAHSSIVRDDIYDALPALLDIAEAAQALDKRNTSHDLDEALAKVRP